MTVEYGATYVAAPMSIYARSNISGSASSTFTVYEALIGADGGVRVGKRPGTPFDLPAASGSTVAGGAMPAGVIGSGKTAEYKLVPTNLDANTVELRFYVNGVQLGGVSVDTAALPLGYSGFGFGAGTAGVSSNNLRIANFSTGTAASSALTFERFQNYEVKQRAALTGPTLFATGGDVPSNTSSIRYRLLNSDGGAVIQGYTAPGSLILSSGRWSGTLSLPQPGLVRMDIEVQALDSGGAVLATVARSQIGVGEVLIDGPGDSNGIFRHWEQVEAGPPVSGGSKWASIWRDRSIDPIVFRQDMVVTKDGAPVVPAFTGNAGHAMAAELTTRLGVPVMFVILSAGGLAIDDWANGGPPGMGLSAALLVVHNVRGFISQIGYNDATLLTFTGRDQQAQRRRDLFAQWRSIIGARGAGGSATIPAWIVGSSSNQAKADPSPALGILNRLSELDNAREANNYYVCNQAAVQRTDAVHLGNSGNIAQGHMIGRAVAATILGQPSTALRIVGATAISPTVTRVQVSLPSGATDIKTAGGGDIKGLQVGTDEAMTSPVAVPSGVRFSSTEFDVTHASVGTGPRFCRYGDAIDAGAEANGLAWLTDNQQFPQTLEPTRGSFSIRPLTVSVNGQAISAQLTTLP